MQQSRYALLQQTSRLVLTLSLHGNIFMKDLIFFYLQLSGYRYDSQICLCLNLSRTYKTRVAEHRNFSTKVTCTTTTSTGQVLLPESVRSKFKRSFWRSERVRCLPVRPSNFTTVRMHSTITGM